MIKKRVFLLGDIGNDKSGFYHVGDEAMFLSNLENYKKEVVEVFASSRKICHSELKNHEVLDIYILNLYQFMRLVFNSILFRFFNINKFPEFFKKTVNTLITCDTLHISGGGNLTSLWQGHIYYRSLMIIIAKLYGKKVILTSQSLGPISKFNHKIILHFILNKVDYLGIRDKNFSVKTIKMLGINKSLVHFNYDDALFWQSTNKPNSKHNKFVNIGISLHDPKNAKITSEIADFLSKLANKYQKINFFIIPHMFDSNNGYDVKYAHFIMKGVKNSKIKIIDHKYLKTNKASFAKQIRKISGKMDMIVASRYHGLVFAISSQIPFLAINYDGNYYKGKNSGLVEIFTQKYKDFVVDFSNIKSDYILSKFNKIYSQRQVISQNLRNLLVKAHDENKKTKNSIYRLEWNSIKI